MRLNRRKLTLQLTPLLDLMLIVFFMQYLELRQRETARSAVVTVREEQAVSMRQELEAALRTIDELTRRESLLRSELTLQQAAAEELASQAALERGRFNASAARQQLLGRLVVDLFGLPQSEIDRVLDPEQQPGLERTPAEVARLRERFQEMSAQSPGRMIRHLLTWEEIRKRCDVWELFIDPQHLVTIDTGERREQLRLHLLPNGRPDLPRFEEEFFQLYRSLPEPKSLVVMLLTYHRDTRLIVTEPLTHSFAALTRRLTDDARGRVRFEYADLGIRDEPVQ
ncbi:MAG: hypothetical protein KF774_13825 [Planctomyces sp.]|nr:hypothetical protein [Planctomyces sp.]